MKSRVRAPFHLTTSTAWRVLAMMALAATAFSCADEPIRSAPAAPGVEDLTLPDAEFALHAFIESPGGTRRVDVPPLEANLTAEPGAWITQVSTANPAEGIEHLLPPDYEPPAPPAPEQAEGSGAPQPHPQGAPQPAARQSDGDRQAQWEVALRYFATQCGVGQNPLLGTVGTLARAPWETGKSYLFPPAQTCDAVLAYQEAALCIAERMTAIADAVDTVRLDGGDGTTMVIPPQAERDRFIVRDVAMNALAAIAKLDTTALPTLGGMTCSAAYGASPGWVGNTSRLTALFGTTQAPPYFPPAGIAPSSSADIKLLSESRLSFEAHVMRAANRLVDKLVRDSVYADLATAEERRQTAPDPVEGARRAWGLTPLQLAQLNGASIAYAPSNYGSLAHAVRATHGRLELGSGQADPKCGGAGAMELVTPSIYGPAMMARVEDRRVRTAGQRTAVAAIQKSGIVIPASVLANTSAATLRAVVTQQAIKTAAEALGITDLAAFSAWGKGAALEKTLSSLSDEDLRFGLDRNFRRYQMLTSSPASSPAALEIAGLKSGALVPAMAGLNGLALKNGISTGDTCGTTPSRTGGITAASQCDETMSLAGALNADFAIFESHQSAVSLAQTLGRRLVVLRERASAAGMAKAAKIAKVAAAESRAWAAQGRVTVSSTTGGATTTVHLNGFSPKDLGARDEDEMAANIALVYGEPWVAECAARTRAACPDDFSSKYVQKWTGKQISAPTPAVLGTDGKSVVLTFPKTAPQFAPQFASGSTPSKQLYVVMLHDPLHASRGRVLGSVALRSVNGATSFAWALGNAKGLLDGVLGCEEGKNASEGPSYCIDGAPRDLFVPLENELTSDSDSFENSWRHYLNLARSAAVEADTLGKEMIQIGEQQDLRRENATELLAQECGEFVDIGDVPIVDGQVQAPKDDGALAACLDDAKLDVVFLGTDEVGDWTDDDDNGDGVVDNEDLDEQKAIRVALGCLDPDPHDMPNQGQETNPLCMSGKPISHAGLGLVPRPKTGDDSDEDRKALLELAGSMTTGFKGAVLEQRMTQPWATNDNINALLQNVQLSVGLDGDWSLFVKGRKRMASKVPGPGDESLWPGCLGASPACTAASPYVEYLNALFGPVGAYNAAARARILWQLEGALWTLASVGGTVPAQLFKVPVAARELAGGPPAAPMLTVFGKSKFNPSGYLMFDTSDQVEAMGRTDPPGPWTYLGQPDVPQWLQDVAANSAIYRRQVNTNTSILLRSKPDSTAEWTKVKQALDGAQCGTAAAPAACTDPGLKVTDVRLCDWGAAADPRILELHSGAGSVTVDFNYILRGTGHHNDGGDIAGYKLEQVSPAQGDFNPHQYGVYERGDPKGSVANLSNFPFKHLFHFVDGSCVEYPSFAPSIPGCIHPVPGGIPAISAACADAGIPTEHRPASWETYYPNDDCESGHAWEFNIAANFTTVLLRPTVCGPPTRVAAFVNAYHPTVPGSGAWQAMQAFGLAFLYGDPRAVVLPLPTAPPVTKLSDLALAVEWVDQTAKAAESLVRALYVEDIPQRVIDDFHSKYVGSGSLRGTHGTLLLELEKALEQVVDGWVQATALVAQMRDAIETARVGIELQQVQEETELAQLAIQSSQNSIALVNSVASMVAACSPASSFGGTPGVSINTGACAAGIVASQQTALELDSQSIQIDKLKALAQDGKVLAVTQTLTTLHEQSVTLQTQLALALGSIRTGTADAMAHAHQIVESEQRARYEVAKGSGADFLVNDNGEPLFFPVNTVNRRLYDVTKLRYERALRAAKYYSYMARIAIEQRIGRRFDTISEPVGVLEPPAQWVNDVCNLVGIDYGELRDCELPDGGDPSECLHDKEIIADFADQYVGDYVAKLEQFVEYYNVQYPSHEGDDVALLSLRDDFLSGKGACSVTSPNQLYFAADLRGSKTFSELGGDLLRGWSKGPCDAADKCLVVDSAFAMSSGSNAVEPAEPGVFAGVTWLHEVTGPDAGPAPADAEPDWPRSVVQTLSLDAGRYVLSWWDQARAPDGAALADQQTAVTYRVGVYSSMKALVPGSAFVEKPFVDPGGQGGWSERRSVAFDVETAGSYAVVIGASAGAELGSVAISNVQLELTHGDDSPGPYVGTLWSRSHIEQPCPTAGVGELRDAFVHRCDPTGCFQELDVPLAIDTVALAAGQSTLEGKLAAGNFNYRHLTVAVNLVGTSVHDCGADSNVSCYGSGYLEYTLDHDAFDVPVASWSGNVTNLESQHFNFGQAHVNHAKALAAERYLTLPLGSADQTLVQQPEVQKVELRGRPLDGFYRLRIWDSPDLQWSNVEDVQILLNYRYWSVIEPQP